MKNRTRNLHDPQRFASGKVLGIDGPQSVGCRKWHPLAIVLGALVAGDVVGCRPAPSEESPEWVVQEFVERMRRVHGDPDASRAAYELLWLQAQQNLAERAKRASALAGQKVAPEEMLAPSRFSLEFQPKEYVGRVDGQWAEVTVTGEAPATQRRTVLVTRDAGRWRVVLRLPQLPPIRHRPTLEP